MRVQTSHTKRIAGIWDRVRAFHIVLTRCEWRAAAAQMHFVFHYSLTTCKRPNGLSETITVHAYWGFADCLRSTVRWVYFLGGTSSQLRWTNTHVSNNSPSGPRNVACKGREEGTRLHILLTSPWWDGLRKSLRWIGRGLPPFRHQRVKRPFRTCKTVQSWGLCVYVKLPNEGTMNPLCRVKTGTEMPNALSPF